MQVLIRLPEGSLIRVNTVCYASSIPTFRIVTVSCDFASCYYSKASRRINFFKLSSGIQCINDTAAKINFPILPQEFVTWNILLHRIIIPALTRLPQNVLSNLSLHCHKTELNLKTCHWCQYWKSNIYVSFLLATDFRWKDDLQFDILFNSIAVILGWWAGDNERLCANWNPIYDWKELCLRQGLNPRPLDQ